MKVIFLPLKKEPYEMIEAWIKRDKTMKFTTPCFVCVKYADQREKLITWLEHIGYDCSTARVDVEYYGKTELVFVVANDGNCRIQHNRPMAIHEYDCGSSIELFKALAAMNYNNDYMQWFTDGRDWRLCPDVVVTKMVIPSYALYNKATAEEVVEHFKNRKG